jgi:hypothetical protein
MRNTRAPVLWSAVFLLAIATTALAQNAPSLPAPGGAQRPGLSQEAIDNLSHKHADHYGALAPQNL